MGAFKDKIIKELNSNKQYDLANTIGDIDSDLDVANYLSANRTYFTKVYNSKDLDLMPEFRKAIYTELKTGEVDYDKEFGEDWHKNFGNIPTDQIKFVADKQGKSFNQLTKEMSKEATRRNRYDIAHEGVLGTVMPFVTPRIQESIERGESPSAKDVVIDFGENAVQAVPWGRASMLAVNNPIVRRLIGGTISNTTAPLLTEVADAAAYDSTNTRGNFDIGDVAAGAGVNALGANLLKGVAGRGATVVGAEDAGKKLMNLGEGETLTQALTKDLKDISKLEARNDALMKRNAKGEALSTNMAGSNQQRIDAINYEKNRDAMENRKQILEEIDFTYNNNRARDKVYGKNNHTTLPSNFADFADNYYPEGIGALTDEQLKFMQNDPVLQKYINVDLNLWPKESRYMKEEAIKNLITNKLGGWMDEQGKAWTRIPVVGPMIQRNIDEEAKQDSVRAKQDSIIYDLFTRGLIYK